MFRSKVIKGSGDGRKIGFPTVNLNPNIFPKKSKEGVYAAKIVYQNRTYDAGLYYGPRLVKGESHPVLEIYIIDFSKQIYGSYIQFKLIKYIRKVKYFSSMHEMQKQIELDLDAIRKALGR